MLVLKAFFYAFATIVFYYLGFKERSGFYIFFGAFAFAGAMDALMQITVGKTEKINTVIGIVGLISFGISLYFICKYGMFPTQ